jgi:hypothetical protein
MARGIVLHARQPVASCLTEPDQNTCRTDSPSFPPILVGETRFVHAWTLGGKEVLEAACLISVGFLVLPVRIELTTSPYQGGAPKAAGSDANDDRGHGCREAEKGDAYACHAARRRHGLLSRFDKREARTEFRAFPFLSWHEYGDLASKGIIDPTKVAPDRSAGRSFDCRTRLPGRRSRRHKCHSR